MTGFRLRALLVAAGLGLAAILASLYRPGYRTLQQMNVSLRDAEVEHQRLEAEHAHLSQQVELLRDDPLELEREARQQLGLVRPGEVIYKFPPADDAR